MTYDFTSVAAVVQSYKDDGMVILKVCVQWNPVEPRLRFKSNFFVNISFKMMPLLNKFRKKNKKKKTEWLVTDVCHQPIFENFATASRLSLAKTHKFASDRRL